MGPLPSAPVKRTLLIVAIDQFPAWPTLKFVESTDVKEVETFLRKYIRDNGDSQLIKTDQASVFVGSESKK